MKYLKQFLIIILISFAGEMLHSCIPLKIPASIYGLILMFIPAGVGLLNAWEALRPVLIPTMVIVLFSTVIVMAVSGCTTQAVIRISGSPKKRRLCIHRELDNGRFCFFWRNDQHFDV